MRFSRRSLATGVVLFLAACGPDDILSGSAVNDDGRIRSSAYYVAGTGQFPTEIRGNPSNLADSAFRGRILDVLRLPTGLPETTFTLDPEPPVAHTYRLALVFNPANIAVSAAAICANPRDIPVTRVKADLIFVKAAYCHRGEPLAETFVQTTIGD